MRKQYAMAFLLILAFGVVSTMAFQLTNTDDQIPEAYAISDDGTDATITSIKVRPSMAGDRMIIKLSLADMTIGNSYAIGIELTDTAGDYGYYNATGMVTIPAPNGFEEYVLGYYETTYTATAATGSITKIKAKPQGSLDKVKLDITLSDQSVAYDLDINLLGSVLDLTGATILGSDGTAGTHTLSDGTNILYFTAIPNGTSWSETIDTSGITYAGDNTVWEDITSLLVTLADN